MQGDTAKVVLVVPARPAGIEHGGLRHLHGQPDGAITKYVSGVARTQGTRGVGLQPDVLRGSRGHIANASRISASPLQKTPEIGVA